MAKVTCKEEEIIDVEMLPYGNIDAITPETADEARIPFSETCNTTPAACHFFFPVKCDGEENGGVEEGQDPLALNTNISDFQIEQVTVDDELMLLENSPTDSSSFSIIDPSKFVDYENVTVKIEPKNELVDIKPSTSQLEELRRKRKHSLESEIAHEIKPGKYIKLEKEVLYSQIVLKNAVVNIGPKLPLPQCFRRNTIVCSKHDVVKSSSQVKNEWDLPCEGPSQVKKEPHLSCPVLNRLTDQTTNPIILKIYTCSKCNHKCTDPSVHEDHTAACVTDEDCDTEREASVIHDMNKSAGHFRCETCSYKFKHEQNLILHVNKHSTDRYFLCYICDVDFPTIHKLRVHFHESHPTLTKLFGCNVCNYSSSSLGHIREHLVIHNSDINLYCRKCRCNYEDSVDFNNHLMTVHKQTAEKKKRRKRPLKKKSLKKVRKITEYFKQKEKMLATHSEPMSGKILPTEVNNVTENLEGKSEKIIQLESQFRSETIQKGERYFCNGCSYKFMSLENLIKHKELHLNVPRPHRCSECSYESLSLVDMADHAKTHPNQGKVNCNVCSIRMQTWRGLRSHTVKHIYDGLYCSTCRINFEDTEIFWKHMSTDHQRDADKTAWYSCSKCSFTHSILFVFKSHIKKHMTKEIQFCFKEQETNSDQKNGATNKVDNKVQDSTSVCPLQILPSLSSDAKNGRKKVSKCERCKLKFFSAVAFKKHQKTHHSNGSLVSSEPNRGKEDDQQNWNFKCSKCSYKTSQISSFVRHVTFSHALKNEPFKCSFCDTKYIKIRHYVSHLKSHSNSPSYSCRFCNFATKNEPKFVIHMANHSSICCPICVFKTKRMRLFKLHIAKQHKPSSGSFSCSLCPYSSFSQNILSIHCLKCHPQEFASLKMPLPNHLLKIERNMSGISHRCIYCPYICSKQHDLKRHLAKHFANGNLKLVLDGRKRGLSLKKDKKKKYSRKILAESTHHVSEEKVPDVDRTNSSSLKAGGNTSTGSYNPKSINEKSEKNNFPLYKCSQCDFLSKYRKSVANHLLIIHNIIGNVRNHMITRVSTTTPLVTRKKTKSPTKSNRSLNSGTKIVLEKCMRCDVDKFSNYAQLDHKKSGHDAFWKKPYECNKCGCRFINKQSCGRHIMMHQGQNLKCSVCKDFRTHRLDTLKTHHKKCLKKFIQSNGNESCKVTFLHTDKPTENENEEELNSDEESFTCGECDFVTMDVVHLTQHMFIHSGIPDD